MWRPPAQVARVRSIAASLHHAPLLEADEPPLPYDHVVQEVDAEELGGLGVVLGEAHVLRARPGVTAGVETAMLVIAMLIDGANIATSSSLLGTGQ